MSSSAVDIIDVSGPEFQRTFHFFICKRAPQLFVIWSLQNSVGMYKSEYRSPTPSNSNAILVALLGGLSPIRPQDQFKYCGLLCRQLDQSIEG